MSKRPNLNFSAHMNALPPEVARAFAGLTPEPLEMDRDELFFQAGFAAGARGRTRRYAPMVAAALLLVSCGLGAAMIWQNVMLRSPLTLPSPTRGEDSEVAAARDAERENTNRLLSSDASLRQLLRADSSRDLLAGRLTARGWVEDSEQMGNREWAVRNSLQKKASDNLPDAAPVRRPATYLELLRSQQEG
jgi:hypothetical protein